MNEDYQKIMFYEPGNGWKTTLVKKTEIQQSDNKNKPISNENLYVWFMEK